MKRVDGLPVFLFCLLDYKNRPLTGYFIMGRRRACVHVSSQLFHFGVCVNMQLLQHTAREQCRGVLMFAVVKPTQPWPSARVTYSIQRATEKRVKMQHHT